MIVAANLAPFTDVIFAGDFAGLMAATVLALGFLFKSGNLRFLYQQ